MGAKRPAATSARHYQAQYSEHTQLRSRTRAMGAIRTALAMHVAEGGEIEVGTSWDEIIPPAQHAPPEMQPYYGPPTFGVRAPMPAPPPGRHEWDHFRKALPPWLAVASVFPDVLPPEGAAPRGALA
eukprot:scaffold9610_cov110-Isochrysis_galbana.AAC.2